MLETGKGILAPCYHCQGRGVVRKSGMAFAQVTCEFCHGSGVREQSAVQ